MSREIKFRAWDGKELFNIWSLYWFEEEGIVEIKDGKASGHNQSFSIMQYTGLKDKNGVEIYEGDIVEAPHDFGPGGFVKRRFWVDFDEAIGYQWQYWMMSEALVIGNIYENHGLLGKRHDGDKISQEDCFFSELDRN